jgi:Rrf2 family protein
MITREVDYAIRVVLRLAEARSEDGCRLSVSTLSDELRVPYRFLRKICLRLVKFGLLQSVAGKGGGLELSSSDSELSLLDIIESVNPDSVKLNACLVDSGICENSSICVVHSSLNELQRRLNDGLADITVASLLERKRLACQQCPQVVPRTSHSVEDA